MKLRRQSWNDLCNSDKFYHASLTPPLLAEAACSKLTTIMHSDVDSEADTGKMRLAVECAALSPVLGWHAQ